MKVNIVELINLINSLKNDNEGRTSLFFCKSDYKLRFMYPFTYDKWEDGVYVTKSLFRNPSIDHPEFKSGHIYLFTQYKYCSCPGSEGYTTYFIDIDDFKNNKWYTDASTENEMIRYKSDPCHGPDLVSPESDDRRYELDEFIKSDENEFIKLDSMDDNSLVKFLNEKVHAVYDKLN